MEFIEVQGHKIEVRLGRKYRNLSLRMAPGKGVWVNVPLGYSASQVTDFIKKHIEWIDNNLEKFEAQKLEKQYSIGDKIKTRLHSVELVEHTGAGFASRKVGREIKLYVPSLVKQEVLNKVVTDFIAKVMKLECQELLPMRVKELADRYGFKYGKLSFRNNSTNWGSCSAENNISLNVRLMLTRNEVIDYVILHELCHTKVRNHSDQFWSLVESVCPDYKTLRKELKMIR